MLKWIKKIFNVEFELPKKSTKTITDLDIFDTVWVEYNNNIYEGWIFDKTKKRIIVVANNQEFIFYYNRPYDQTTIVNNNKILHLNKC